MNFIFTLGLIAQCFETYYQFANRIKGEVNGETEIAFSLPLLQLT